MRNTPNSKRFETVPISFASNEDDDPPLETPLCLSALFTYDDIDRKQGWRDCVSSRQYKEYHPTLGHVMAWYWDKDAGEEVCYAEMARSS